MKTINALRGNDIPVDAADHVIFRIQGHQWRIDAPSTGTATIKGDWTRSLRYYGGRNIEGQCWIGKTEFKVIIEYKD